MVLAVLRLRSQPGTPSLAKLVAAFPLRLGLLLHPLQTAPWLSRLKGQLLRFHAMAFRRWSARTGSPRCRPAKGATRRDAFPPSKGSTPIAVTDQSEFNQELRAA